MAQTVDKDTSSNRAASPESDTGVRASAESAEEVAVRVGRRCSSCGTAVQRRATYCPECGVALAATGDVPDRSSGSGRWWLAVLVASIVALPIGWILSFAAALPFMIGTFFFAILGLIIGAVTFRVARAQRPYTQMMIILGTTVIVLVGWGYSVHVEAQTLPQVLGKIALKNTRDLDGMSAEAFQASVAERVRGYLATNFAPGGTLGYIRWVVAEGQVPHSEIPQVRKPLSVQQRGWVWIIRVSLSLGLFAFGVASQTLPLAPVQKTRSTTLISKDSTP